ncbi:GHKL domain-containing protein [uncultured Limosilactobacillus sp.]|uniref:GHKL domain-containing protein n=1 Tax=uncultured Limosilactobacillus sp. TaxID=2837629 RepID=UPI0025921139|nr:GHKL domain-containing protein [uncultured Limosilactobacillus sp.]
MTYFNLINPFTLTPSLSFLLIWAIKICVFSPLFFLGTYKHLQSRRLPLCLYLIIAVGAFFLPFNFFINDLIWIVIAIALIYFLVNHGTCSLTDLVASFSYSMLVYYFSQVIVVSLLPLLLQLLASNTAYFVLTNLTIPLCYGASLILIRLTRSFFKRYLTCLQNNHLIAKWLFSLAFLPFSHWFYYSQYNRRLMQLPVLPAGASPLSHRLAFLGIGGGYFLLVLLAMGITGHFLAHRDQADAAEYRLANLARYTSQLEVITDDLRRFRHDYQNILYSLNSALATDKIAYAKRALNHLTHATQRDIKVPTGIIGPLKNIKDPGIKAVVFDKISTALDQGLRMDVEIADPIRLTQTLQQVDAIRIITILFDNAIHAARLSDDKRLAFSLYENQFAQFIVIGNSTVQAQVNLENLANLAHTVTLSKSHQLGLRNLQIILARYPGANNDRSAQHHYFEQRIIVPMKK